MLRSVRFTFFLVEMPEWLLPLKGIFPTFALS